MPHVYNSLNISNVIKQNEMDLAKEKMNFV